MKTIVLSTIAVFLTVLLSPDLSTAGNTDEKQIRNVPSFSAIKASAGVDVILESGPREKVTVIGDAEDIDRIVTEVKNGTLHIYRKGKLGFNFNFRSDCEVHVTAQNLNGLDASSGAEVRGTNLFTGNEIRVNASSGSEISIDLQYEKITAGCSSGAEINLSGTANYFSVSVSSGSEIDACELAAAVVHADASSGGEICVNASAELHASASSGGDIEYEGSPANLDVNKSSGGRVSKN